MDYRVMKRPMFKMGGPTSGGTGITSGLEKPKRGLVDEPGSYAGIKDFSNCSGVSSARLVEYVLQLPSLSFI